MCTFHNEREVTICNVALAPVRAELMAAIGESATFVTVDGEGTRVVAEPTVDPERFTAAVRRGIAQVG
jgi:hypothetical protein